jgi:hypothetical protein
LDVFEKFDGKRNIPADTRSWTSDIVAKAGALGGEKWMKSILVQVNEC